MFYIFILIFLLFCEYFHQRVLVNMLQCSYYCFVLHCSRKCYVWDETSGCNAFHINVSVVLHYVTDFLSLNIFFLTNSRLAHCHTDHEAHFIFQTFIHSLHKVLLSFLFFCDANELVDHLAACFGVSFSIYFLLLLFIFFVFPEREVVLAKGLLLTLGCVFFSSTAIVHHIIQKKAFSSTRYFFTL